MNVLEINSDSEFYPAALTSIQDKPVKLYAKGNVELLNSPNLLAIIGSRNISSYGIHVLDVLFKDFHNIPIVIVSGFMRGVDGYAHRLALQFNIPTIAILPCGINMVYPHVHAKLYKDILDSNGLIVSEYENYSSPRAWTFVKRNRLVAGISRCILIIEAGIKSGSLITYNYARAYNKPVFAVPGDIFSVNSQGINQVLREGSFIIFSGSDVLKHMEINTESNALQTVTNLTICEKAILKELKSQPRTINELNSLLSYSLIEITEFLIALEIKQLIKESGGVYYVI